MTTLSLSQCEVLDVAKYIVSATQVTGEPLPDSPEDHHGHVCSETEAQFLTNDTINSLPDGVCMEVFPVVNVAPVIRYEAHGGDPYVSRYVIESCDVSVFFESEDGTEYSLDEPSIAAIQKAVEGTCIET